MNRMALVLELKIERLTMNKAKKPFMTCPRRLIHLDAAGQVWKFAVSNVSASR